MKKVLLSLFFVIVAVISFAQTQASSNSNERVSTQNINVVTYQLFPTQNMWVFIKLNTRNGQMWQVQYDIKGEDRYEVYLNMLPLVSRETEVNGRFTLYSTQNMWTFILLDQLVGRMWQVQWSMDAEKRGIIPIE